MMEAACFPLGKTGIPPWGKLSIGLFLIAVSTLPAISDADFSPSRAAEHVRVLAGEIGPRKTGTDSARRAVEYIRSELETIGLQVELQPVESVTLQPGVEVVARTVNVLGRLPGNRPGTILIGAHFDSRNRVVPGALDDASGVAVVLELALQRFALDVVIEEGFTPFVTPDVARPAVVEGIGFNPRGEETQIYSLAGEDLCLVGTAEITLGGLYAGAIVKEDELPIRLAGVSHCFRTEAGAAGRESKGLYRVHQFTKVEMFTLTRPEDSEAMHNQLLAIEERIFQALELPYRVVDIAAGDLGAPAYRKFDIEAWMPGRGEGGDYGEVSSASNCTDYQARRLQTRFRRKGAKKNEYVHMLNGTAISNARAILALLENHQQPDGSVAIPAALRPYVGRDTIRPR